MLIDRQEYKIERKRQEQGKADSEGPLFPSPVVGSVKNDHIPTSADVHLYADPATYDGQYPMLYADCEGLDGGEEEPVATVSRKVLRKEAKNMVKFASGKVRAIAWANTDQRCTRQYAVGELYPRLLYTFSDTVVFVLRNAKYVISLY